MLQIGRWVKICKSSRAKESIVHSFLVTGSYISWPLDNLGQSTLSNASLWLPLSADPAKYTQAAVTPCSSTQWLFLTMQPVKGRQNAVANTDIILNVFIWIPREDDVKVTKTI